MGLTTAVRVLLEVIVLPVYLLMASSVSRIIADYLCTCRRDATVFVPRSGGIWGNYCYLFTLRSDSTFCVPSDGEFDR